MANEGTRTRRRHKSHNEGSQSRISISAGGRAARTNVTQEGDEADVRRSHVNLIEVEQVDDVRTRNMASESQATLTSSKSRSRRTKDGLRDERKHRRRRTSAVNEEGPEYVNGEVKRRTRSKPERDSGSDGDDSEVEAGRVKVGKSKSRKVRYVYVTKTDATPRRRSQKKEKYRSAEEIPQQTEETIKRSRSHRTRRQSVVEAPVLGR